MASPAGTYLAVIVALACAVFLMAFTFPFLFDTTQTDQTVAILQDGGVEYEVTGGIVSTATEITNSDANVTLETSEELVEKNIAVGATETFNLSDDEVNVTLTSADNADDQVELEYVHSPFAGYPETAEEVAQYTPLLLIILGLLTVFGLLTSVN